MNEAPTPIRQQYLRVKRSYPQAIVLFRLGDFYETFDKDAEIAAKELDIVLTSREMGKGHRVPMAGIPYHALDGYLARLINRGYKVAICEQMTKPGETKGLVERDVVRVVTPGTVIEPGLLDSKANNYLVSLTMDDNAAGIAYVDITTSEFAVTQVAIERVKAELERLKPSEVVIVEGSAPPDIAAPVTKIESYWFGPETACRVILEHFGVATLDGYGCANLPLAIGAAGAIVHYLKETQKGVISQLTSLTTYNTNAFMALDMQTQKNLEIFQGNRSGTVAGSLLSVIDCTKTPMGSRLLKRWLSQPLLDIAELTRRQDAVAWFVQNTLPRKQVIGCLGNITDLERLSNRVRGNTATPRELVGLKHSLEIVPEIINIVATDDKDIAWLKDAIRPQPDVVNLIAAAIEDAPPASLGEGGVIRRGFSEELDKLRLVSRDARQYLASLESKERQRTGIKSLKVGFNRVFGYYIEISRSNVLEVPADYIRKQTLVGGERFFTPELKEYESTILNARDRIIELESDLFRRVCQQVAAASEPVLALGNALAHLDVFAGLAEVAVNNRYVRPALTAGSEINIKEGRHPVVEQSRPDISFVPNDTYLCNEDAQLIILTGPNMAGKSTYLKQVALLVLLAQIGSFIPATNATIGLVDRIFTRIGAREDIATGQSTFMMEMVETANILNNATPRSLIILDEIGRGTSTYDGLSIARAVAEYIHNSPRLGAKTIFATHYHEMVELAGYLPRVKNYNVAVAEEGGEVVFLYKIVPGGVDKSYGIHVAKLAGLPRSVLHRASEVLDELETVKQDAPLSRGRHKALPSQQLPLLAQKSQVLEELEKLDINSLTPLEALTRLYELQRQAKETSG